MSKYIGVMIAWILVAGLLLYIVQHLQDFMSGASYLIHGGDPKALFNSINSGIDSFFK